MDGSVSNILRVYDSATDAEVKAGLAWYVKGRAECVRATRLPADADGIKAACGIVAALSPQRDWDVNLDSAARFVASGGTASVHYGRNCDVARRILGGADPDNVLSGPKVAAFYRNLVDPHTPGPITIDGHAYCIWTGIRSALHLVKVPRSLKFQRAILRDYTEASKIVGVMPHQIQAITWVTWRRIHLRNSIWKISSEVS